MRGITVVRGNDDQGASPSKKTKQSPLLGGQVNWVFRLFSAGLVVAILISDATAQSVNPSGTAVVQSDLKEDVLDLVDQLDASSLSKRKAAERALIELGPEALRFLPEATPEVSIEATERLARVKKALIAAKTVKQQRADTIRIRLNDVSNLGEALEAISRDSGIEFEHQADESTPVLPIGAPLSFWHALDFVLDDANLDINFYGGDEGKLLLVPRQKDRPSRVDSAAYTGVYRIEPTSVTSRLSLNQPELSGLNVTLEIAWEPRLTPIGLTIPVKEVLGKMSDGAVAAPQPSGDTIDVSTNGELAFSEFFIPLQLPAGQPSKIESISGVIKALLPGKRQDFEMPLSEMGKEKKIDAMTVTIEDIRKNGPLHEVRVSVELEDADRSLESHRHWIFENRVYAKRSDGSNLDHLGYEVYRQTTSGVGIGYFFEFGESVHDAALIYQSPTSVVQNEVPFVIQDVPLP